MKTTLMMLIFALLLPIVTLAGEDPSITTAAVEISASDFEPLRGDGWSGFLKYKDYSSDREVSIPVRLRVLAVDQNTIDYRIEYPDEPQHDSDERITITDHGHKLNGETVVSKTETGDGSLTITTHQQGKDNGNKADIQMTYQISASSFSIQKEVRPENSDGFFTRNTLLLSR